MGGTLKSAPEENGLDEQRQQYDLQTSAITISSKLPPVIFREEIKNEIFAHCACAQMRDLRTNLVIFNGTPYFSLENRILRKIS